jgi:Nucleoside-diphosphate-sugar epimerases
MYGHDGKPGHGPDGAFNESDWTVVQGPGVGAYVKSKTMAERDVWSLVDKHPSLKVTTVCPSFVQGPQLSNSMGTSGEIIAKVMRGELPGFPRLGMTFVDVRDVASLHLLALEHDSTIGERLIANADTLWFREMGEAILEEFPELKGKIKPRELPNFFVRLFALFDRETKLIVPELGYYRVASNAKARELVGWEPRSGREAVRAAARSLVELGVVQCRALRFRRVLTLILEQYVYFPLIGFRVKRIDIPKLKHSCHGLSVDYLCHFQFWKCELF